MNFYSEFDPYAAQWLRNLIRDGHIPPGHVDERDLWDVHPDDLREFTQVHLCAGIGLWPLSLRRAGWDDDRPIWSASFPCQPFSSAGAGLGFADERHLWPAGYHLITQCRPGVICGEQVASKDGYAWLDLVQTDMEGLAYTMWPVVLPVAGVGGPHERHRQFWVGLADSEGGGLGVGGRPVISGASGYLDGRFTLEPLDGGGWAGPLNGFWRDADWLFCTEGKWRPVEPGTRPLAHGLPLGMGTLGAGLRGLCDLAGIDGNSLKRAKQYRVGTLRGYGNAIVPDVAVAFIEAWMDAAP